MCPPVIPLQTVICVLMCCVFEGWSEFEGYGTVSDFGYSYGGSEVFCLDRFGLSGLLGGLESCIAPDTGYEP